MLTGINYTNEINKVGFWQQNTFRQSTDSDYQDIHMTCGEIIRNLLNYFTRRKGIKVKKYTHRERTIVGEISIQCY